MAYFIKSSPANHRQKLSICISPAVSGIEFDKKWHVSRAKYINKHACDIYCMQSTCIIDACTDGTWLQSKYRAITGLKLL